MIFSPNGRGRGLKPALVAPHLRKMSAVMHPQIAAMAGSAQPIDFRDLDGGTNYDSSIRDQGKVGSCVGTSGSGATETAFSLLGQPLGFVPSEDIGYKGARSVERARGWYSTMPLPPLEDNGAQTEDYELWLARYGLAPRWRAKTPDGRNSDCDLDTCNDDLDLAKVEAAGTLLVPGSYAIDPTSSAAEDLVQATLSARIPVRCDNFVDMVFENWTKGDAPVPAPNENDPNGGWHAQYLMGWSRLSNGQAVYFVHGSWGTDIADGGYWLVSSAWIRASGGLFPWTVRRG